MSWRQYVRVVEKLQRECESAASDSDLSRRAADLLLVAGQRLLLEEGGENKDVALAGAEYVRCLLASGGDRDEAGKKAFLAHAIDELHSACQKVLKPQVLYVFLRELWKQVRVATRLFTKNGKIAFIESVHVLGGWDYFGA